MPAGLLSAVRDIKRDAGFYTRLIEAGLFISAYLLLLYLHSFASPIDFTPLMLSRWNLSTLAFCHKIMSRNAWMALFFKVIYYGGLSMALVPGAAYLLLTKRYLLFDRMIYAFIVAYGITFPIFFTFTTNEPLWAGVGFKEDIMLWQGQSLASTNFMTKPNFTFPSGHVFLTTIVAAIYFHVESRIKYFFYALAVLVPLTTLLLGQHWIEDVPAGFDVAIFALLFTSKYGDEYSKRIDLLQEKLQTFWQRALKK